MNFIIDASAALAWCFADEKTKESELLLEKLISEAVIVPSIWSLEIGNILIGALKKGRITYAGVMQFLTLLKKLDIRVDEETNTRAFHEILTLAHSQDLTTYDASYLELAMRLGLPLATKDKELKVVAEKLGVVIFSL